MDRHEELRPEKEVDILRLKTVFRRAEVYAVQDQVEIIAVGFNLRVVRFAQRVLDGQLVEVEDVAEHSGLFGGRTIQIDPHPHAAAWLEPGRIHAVDRPCGPPFVHLNTDQSPPLADSAACAAASRATGTR